MTKNLKNSFRYYLKLSKLNVMIPVSLTGFTGYFIFDPSFSIKLFSVTFGVLLLAVSASVLNQIQETKSDSMMNRTKDRPIPTGAISLQQASVFFILTFIAGITIVWISGNIIAAVIGLVTLIWYNGIYTYLKRITAFAVFPGSVTGALPPLLGWVAAGGGIWDKSIVFVEFLFFIGQVPHFWLLVLKYGDEYKEAGFPSLTAIFTPLQINRLTFTWVVVSAISGLFLCYFGIIKTVIIVILLLIASFILIYLFSDLLKTVTEKINYRKYSIILGVYFLLVSLMLIADRIIVR